MDKLDKKIILGLVLTLVIAIFVPLYWLNEPARQASAAEKFKLEAMGRGAEHYVETCARCHGTAGRGLVGPALKGTALDSKTLEKAISRGVPGSAMPAWGEDDGGPFRAHEVQDLVTFILNWDDSLLGASNVPVAGEGPASTPRPASPATQTRAGTSTPTVTASTQSTPSATTSATPSTPSASEAGREIFSNLGCVACHGTKGEGGPVAPTLIALAGKEVELATGEKLLRDDGYLRESIKNPAVKLVKGFQSVSMPPYNLPDSELDQLVNFLSSLK